MSGSAAQSGLAHVGRLTLTPALVLSVLLVLCLCDMALAQGAGGTVDAAIDRMESSLAHLGNNLGQAARGLLLILFTVDLVLRFGRWAVEGSSFNQVFSAWIYQLGFVAMVYTLALQVPELVEQLTGLAARFAGYAGGIEEPSGSKLITAGLKQAAGWIGVVEFESPSTWAYVLAAFVSVIVTAMVVAFLVIVYAEIHLVGLAGIIVLGLAGLEETRSAATAYIRLLVGKALKLMALIVVYSSVSTLTSAIVHGGAVSTGLSAALGTIMLQIIGALLIISLPSTVEGLVNSIGSRAGETGALVVGGAATKGSMVAGGAAIGAGWSVARFAAGKLAGWIRDALGKGGGAAASAAATAAKAGGKAAVGATGAGAAGSGLKAATDALSGKAASDLKERITKAMGKDS